MMKYEYTNDNLLENPQKYMYTPYRGMKFLKTYFLDRRLTIERFESQNIAQEIVEWKMDLFNAAELLLKQNQKSKIKPFFVSEDFEDVSNLVNTQDIFNLLLFKQLSGSYDTSVKSWIDFFTQRFEVTKKLYEAYCSSNLRKGEGDFNNILLYWLFSLILTIFYSKTNNLKYLSTALKVNDLLCSLDEKVFKYTPKQGIILVLSKEMENIGLLLDSNQGSFTCQ